MHWLLFLPQLPSTPSSLRVSVWRKLKAVGALRLQNGIWLLPDTPEHQIFSRKLLELIKEQGAGGQIFLAHDLDPVMEQEVLTLFRSDREEEYNELDERCWAFLDEIKKESQAGKFSFAELEEAEDDFKKLEAWLKKILARDVFPKERDVKARQIVETCRAALADFTNEVTHRADSDQAEE